MVQITLFATQKQTHRYSKQIYGYQGRKEGQDELGNWKGHIHSFQFTMYKKDN